MANTALDGIKVLELCEMIAGPYCTKIFADYGAEVIKIEKPGIGDDARRNGPFPDDKPNPEISGLYLYLNTNKKSITLDLETPTGVRILKELVKYVDILVESSRSGVMASLGLDFDTLKEINPGLIMTSISWFGQTGPYREYEASDLTIWALSGILYECGEAEREPLKIGSNQTEYVAGLCAAMSTLSALYYRNETGIGQHLDVSSWEAFHITEPYMALLNSQIPGFARKRAGIHWPWGILPCKDGYVGFFFPTQTHWESLCTLLGMPEMATDPRYETPFTREAHIDEITGTVVSWLQDKCMEDVFHDAQELRLPLTPVPNMAQIVNLPQHKARGYFVYINHPIAGRITYPGALFRLSETQWRKGRAPLLGEHNKYIYSKYLGCDKNDIAMLKEQGIV